MQLIGIGLDIGVIGVGALFFFLLGVVFEQQRVASAVRVRQARIEASKSISPYSEPSADGVITTGDTEFIGIIEYVNYTDQTSFTGEEFAKAQEDGSP